MAIIISGTGSFIPERVISDTDFLSHEFYTGDGEKINSSAENIIKKFEAITGIAERRYAEDDHLASHLATMAATKAICDAGVDAETIDGIIVAHNFGDIPHGGVQTDILPCIAARVKHYLRIRNPGCIAFDILFGCPGWIQGVIVARQYLLSGDASRFLVIGTDALSRVLDPHDRDSMIFADGAGAAIIETDNRGEGNGIISAVAETYAFDEAFYLHYDTSFKKDHAPGCRYIKMKGRKIYEFALGKVPLAMKQCLDKAGVPISDLAKIFIHQANEKMDHAIIERLYELYDSPVPEHIMPMSIRFLGNSSVATIPTLYDLVRKETYPEHRLAPGDLVLFASVGAGMNINAILYRV